MICPTCGSELPDDATFCPKCGTSVRNNANTKIENTPAAPGFDAVAPATAGSQVTLTWLQWFLVLFVPGLLSLVPVIGGLAVFVGYIVVACMDKNTFKYPELVTFARAILLFTVLIMVLFVVLMILFALVVGFGAQGLSGNY